MKIFLSMLEILSGSRVMKLLGYFNYIAGQNGAATFHVVLYRGAVSTGATGVMHPSILRSCLLTPVDFRK